MTKEEREREICRVEKLMPLKPDPEALRTMEQQGLIGGHVIVYKCDAYYEPITELRKQAVRCRCSACGGVWYTTKLTGGCHRGGTCIGFENYGGPVWNGESTVCPDCGEEVRALHVSSFGSALRYRVDECFFITVENVGGHLGTLEWYAERTVDKDAVMRTDIYRREATVVIGGKCVRFSGHQRQIGGRESWWPRWEARKQYREASYASDMVTVAPFDPAVVGGTDSDKSGLEDYLGGLSLADSVFPALYLQVWCKYPKIENLARTGYARYLSGLLQQCIYSSYSYMGICERTSPMITKKYTDWKKKRPCEMLHLTKDEYRRLAGETFEVVNYYVAMKEDYGLRMTDELLEKAKQVGLKGLRVITKDREHFGKVISPVRIINYCYKQKTGNIEPAFLLDHWRILNDLYGELPEDLLFPSDFGKAHTHFADLLAKRKNESQDRKIRKQADKMSRYSWRDEETGLMIFPADSTEALAKEGKTLHHCVGGYAADVAAGRTTIFFVRRIEAPDTPFFTLEFKGGAVQQNRGDHNCARTEDVQAFENKWLAFVKDVDAEKQKEENRSGQSDADGKRGDAAA